MGVWTGGFIALGFSRIRSTPSRRSLGPESVRSMHGFMGTWADGFMGALAPISTHWHPLVSIGAHWPPLACSWVLALSAHGVVRSKRQ